MYDYGQAQMDTEVAVARAKKVESNEPFHWTWWDELKFRFQESRTKKPASLEYDTGFHDCKMKVLKRLHEIHPVHRDSNWFKLLRDLTCLESEVHLE